MEHILRNIVWQFSKCFSYTLFSFIIIWKIQAYGPYIMDMEMN